ncbi:unnamed protein product [Somion occarium]|uniref:Uncharacterized protein n=1 Tax=Somion occarium TaxID=3059160 RepID=A0ABP1CSJ7_9APHY
MQDPVENLALSLIKGHSAVEGVLNLKEGPPGVRREDRQGQRKYIRDNINPKFRRAVGVPEDSPIRVPWGSPVKLITKYFVRPIGYPLKRPLTDPSKLTMEELWIVVCAVYQDIFKFRRLTYAELRLLDAKLEESVRMGLYEPERNRQERADKGNARGRHRNPLTTRKTYGGYICSPEMVAMGEDPDDPIEEFSE